MDLNNALASHSLIDKPSAWVERFAPLIPAGEVLDLACGGGRHARLLAGLGHPVLAVDLDLAALEHAAATGVVTQQVDLENGDWPYESERFAGIVVTNYLHRPLFPRIFRSLAPGGVLIYETFAEGNEQFGKPSNPRFLLQRGELLKHVAIQENPSLRVISFEDGYVSVPRPAMVQRICVVQSSKVTVVASFRL